MLYIIMENKTTYIKTDDNKVIKEKYIRWVKKWVIVWKFVPDQMAAF